MNTYRFTLHIESFPWPSDSAFVTQLVHLLLLLMVLTKFSRAEVLATATMQGDL